MAPVQIPGIDGAGRIDAVRSIDIDDWMVPPDASGRSWQQWVETGQVLHFPRLAFPLHYDETPFLSQRWSDGKSKNISYRPATGVLRGVRTDADLQARTGLREMLLRYARCSDALVGALFPGYVPHLQPDAITFRPFDVAQRETSWRKDDTRLHVDAFPSKPTHGLRVLRVFTNVHPAGQARVWRIGEPFEQFARRYIRRTALPLPGWCWLLHQLRITKSQRSAYDHLMLQLHDAAKADLAFQQTSPQQTFAFLPGTTWIVFSDQVLHAAMAGQFMLERTFFLKPQALLHPESTPLHVLERLKGQALLTH